MAIAIPTKEECMMILKENNVPDNVISHVKAVCDFAIKVVNVLMQRGVKVNQGLVIAGTLLHDIKKISNGDHVIEGYELIKSIGFPEVAEIIKKHGLYHLEHEEFTPRTWEEKIVFYADKRIKNDRIVSVEERFEYIKQRYKKDDVQKEIEFTKKIEYGLLGDEKID